MYKLHFAFAIRLPSDRFVIERFLPKPNGTQMHDSLRYGFSLRCLVRGVLEYQAYFVGLVRKNSKIFLGRVLTNFLDSTPLIRQAVNTTPPSTPHSENPGYLDELSIFAHERWKL